MKNRPEITGKGLLEQIEDNTKLPVTREMYKYPQISEMPFGAKVVEAIDDALEDYIKSNMELIKSVEVEDNKIIKEEFHSDLKELSPLSEEEQYEILMNTFLNRRDKRKLSKFKGKLSFTDRMYARKK